MKNLIPYLDEKVEEYIIFNGIADLDSISEYSEEVKDTIVNLHESYLVRIYIRDKLNKHFGITSHMSVNRIGLKILRGEAHD